jgi:hypothetical protein
VDSKLNTQNSKLNWVLSFEWKVLSGKSPLKTQNSKLKTEKARKGRYSALEKRIGKNNSIAVLLAETAAKAGFFTGLPAGRQFPRTTSGL